MSETPKPNAPNTTEQCGGEGGETSGQAPSPKDLAQMYANANNSDVILYNGPIFDTGFRDLVASASGPKGAADNVLLILVTPGGDAHVAYQCARLLQKNYKKFSISVPFMCKSAGTLLAIGAHEIIMSSFGELGPLDVQVLKEDELLERRSGAVVLSAFEILEKQCYKMFQRYMLDILQGSEGKVTLRTSMEMATKFATSVYSPIFAQIDPNYVGEMHRNMRVTFEYGERLAQIGGNINPDKVHKLVYGYPEHRFVIDDHEAEKLFKRVSKPDKNLATLQACLGARVSNPRLSLDLSQHDIVCLARPDSPVADESEQEGYTGAVPKSDLGGETDEQTHQAIGSPDGD